MSAPPDFERLYAGNADPWQVATSPYEQRKLDVVLACLLQPRYQRAWDPASGTGHLAARLATRVGHVLATDLSPRAVDLTATTCRSASNVETAAHALPAAPPASWAGRLDLVVLSEFFYYLDDRTRIESLATIDRAAAPACELLAVHWRHVPDDAWLSGASAQQEIVSRLGAEGWAHQLHHDDTEFVLDTVVRTGAAE